jgi:hypothetical protein
VSRGATTIVAKVRRGSVVAAIVVCRMDIMKPGKEEIADGPLISPTLDAIDGGACCFSGCQGREEVAAGLLTPPTLDAIEGRACCFSGCEGWIEF